jgi:acyl-coenzyme A thioesterase PaaI-like protein
MKEQSLQDRYASHNQCFGCGPANDKGLRIKSFPQGNNEVVADWQAQPFHEAFPGILNGGIIGTILDCHSNWSAAYFIMQHLKVDSPPCTVTAYFNVTLKRPTPSQQPVHLVAKLKEIKEDRAIIFAELYVDDKLCATCEGMFVAVKEGHPAYHRW